MNNVGSSLIHRLAGSCLQPLKWPKSARVLRSNILITQSRCYSRISQKWIWNYSRPCYAVKHTRLVSFAIRTFTHTRISRQAPQEDEQEYGLDFREDDLSQDELHDVFGAASPPPRSANHLLRILHGRRTDGTLDLPLDVGCQATLKRYPQAMDSALHWLRSNYPVDEDAAIVERIEREERGEEHSPARLRQESQDMGLYSPQDFQEQEAYHGPQSGKYQAKLSKNEGDVFGRSAVDEIRAENIAKAEAEEQKVQAEIDRITAEVQEKQEEKSKALAQRPEQGVEVADEVRPPNEYEKWKLRNRMRAVSTFSLDSPEVVNKTFFQRVWPSAMFVTLLCAGCYLYAQYWSPPRRSQRMFPDLSLSVATVGALVCTNFLVFALWRVPGMWPVMNKYLICTPAFPRAVSMLGNTFSHQTTRHLFFNMLTLIIFGPALHEDIGRGNFMAIYLASGAFGSLASLSVMAWRKVLISSSLGASGSIWGIVSAYCWVHSDEKFSFVFIPEDWQDSVKFSGWTLLVVLIGFEVMYFFRPAKNIDYASHLGGLVVGVIGSEAWKRSEGVCEGKVERKKGLRWYEHLVGKQVLVDKD